jgi:hypothetical protein
MPAFFIGDFEMYKHLYKRVVHMLVHLGQKWLFVQTLVQALLYICLYKQSPAPTFRDYYLTTISGGDILGLRYIGSRYRRRID